MAVSPERMLISSLLRDNDYPTVMGANIDSSMFRAYHDEFEYLEKYYAKHRKMPTRFLFKNKFPQCTIEPVNDTSALCDDVRASHIRARLLDSIKDVTDYISSGEIEAAAKLMHSEIVKITAETNGTGDCDLISDWQALFDEAQAKADRVDAGGLAGIPSGFPSFDAVTGGYQPGEFHVIAARLGEFKSWIMMRNAAAALQAGKIVQYNTLEMSRTQVGYRMHSLLSGGVGKGIFSNLELQQGRNFDPKKYRQFLRELKFIIKGSFFVTDGSRGKISPMTIAAQIERNRPDIVFIDYITLMDGAIGGDWKSIATLTGELKSIAQQYQIPIIGAAQLNRTAVVGKEAAGPEAIAQADSIGQDADSVQTARKLSESVLNMRLAKYRHGPANQKWYVDVRPAEGVFEEVSYNKAMDLKDRDQDAQDAREAAGPPKVKATLADGTAVPRSQSGSLKKRPAPSNHRGTNTLTKPRTISKPSVRQQETQTPVHGTKTLVKP